MALRAMIKFFPLSLLAALGAAGVSAQGLAGHSLELKSRVVQFDVDQLGTSNDFKQSAVGLQLEYKSPLLNDFIGVELAAYQVGKLAETGAAKNELLPFRPGSAAQIADSWSALGKALVKIKHGDLFEANLGRQAHNSLLLKSTYSRAVEDTFSGVSMAIRPAERLRVYGAAYDAWLPRSGNKFVKLGTEQSPTSSGQVTRVIDHVAILGVQYFHGPYQIDVETLNSKDYLRKHAAVGSYLMPLKDKDSLKLSVGASTSANAGPLFTCAAGSSSPEKELDNGSCGNHGRGLYFSTEWKTGPFTVVGAVAKFRGLWIEDNFAGSNPARGGKLIQDHGTNFFPTGATSGNDMTNDGELTRMVRVGYDWKAIVPGLTTVAGYKLGTGARNNTNPALGNAKERESEFDVRYAIPLVKGLNARYNYLKYSADVSGVINAINEGGSKTYRRDHRLYLDYTHRFF